LFDPLSRFSNTWFIQNKDGLGKYPDLVYLYEQASALDAQVDELSSEAAAYNLVSTARGIRSAINSSLDVASQMYEWDLPWGRSTERQKRLFASIDAAYDAIQAYHQQIPPALNSVRASIDARIASEQARKEQEARQAAEAAKRAAEEQARLAAEEARRRAEENQKEVDAITAAQVAAATGQSQVDLIRVQTEQAIKNLTAAKIFGLPVTAVVGGVGALGVLGFLILRKKKRS